MVLMGLTGSWWAAAMLPAALLIAFAFGAIGMAVTTYMRSIQDLDMVQVAVLPMFLFSGTFYSLSVYPAWLRIVVECLPLNQGIQLLRGLNAFRQSLDTQLDVEGLTQLQLKQNRMMWARIKYQGAAIIAVVLAMLLAGGR